jgi:hypothetical protein
LFLPEIEAEFTIKLKDTTADENESVSLSCEVNKPDISVDWVFNKNILVPSEKYNIGADGVTHTLTIADLTPEDTGTYTARVGDTETNADLTVTGELKKNCKNKLHMTFFFISDRKHCSQVECCSAGTLSLYTGYEKACSTGWLKELAFCSPSSVYAWSYLPSELPVHIIVPLKDTEVTEGETVTLTCEVNIPDLPARWFKDKVEIFPTDDRQMSVEGTVHKLTIPKSVLEDEAEYLVVIGGRQSKALLLVEGESMV